MFERFTEKSIKVIMLAQEEARRLGHNFVGTEQMLLGLIGEGTGIAAKVLKSMGIYLKDARMEVEKIIGRGTGFVSVEIPFTERARRVLELSWDEAKQLGHNYMGTEHLLLGLLREGEGVAVRVLENLGIELSRIRSNVIRLLAESKPGPNAAQHRSNTPILNAFGVNFNQMAEENRLDSVVGRYTETERICRILCKRAGNNPLLIGASGVGKTAIIRGLANRIVSGDVPNFLLETQLVILYASAVVAGTGTRGDLEARLNLIVDEVKAAGNVILVLEDLHTWIGAGAGKISPLDAATILLPALTHGEVRCIGITTLDGYENYIKYHGDLERQFQPVMIDAPSLEQTIEILKCLSERYEAHHRLQIEDRSLEVAARLAERHIPDRFLPAKAVELLDEACALVQIRSTALPPPAIEKERELRTFTKRKEAAIRQQDFEQASKLRDEEQRLRDEIREIGADWRGDERNFLRPVVTINEIATVASDWTGIPAADLLAELESNSDNTMKHT
jgi:ATP-dependent Clp protease ATP-binding subunit ClpC